MRGRVHKSTSERGCEEVPKCVALLEHTRHETTGGFGAVFKGRGGCIAIQTAHGDAEEGAHGKKLGICLCEAGPKFEDDEEDVVDDKRPVNSTSVSQAVNSMVQLPGHTIFDHTDQQRCRKWPSPRIGT